MTSRTTFPGLESDCVPDTRLVKTESRQDDTTEFELHRFHASLDGLEPVGKGRWS